MGRTRKPIAAGSRVIPRLLRCLRERGADVDALIRRLHLPAHAERAEEVRLTPDDFELLLSAAARELDDPLLAVRLPELLEWQSYNIGELAARASPTLREAFERVARYASLFYAHLAFACEDRGEEFVVTQRLRSPAAGARYGSEFALASTLVYARRLSGVDLQPRRVFFAHAEPPEIDALRRHFGTHDISFLRGENGLVFAAKDVMRPSIGHDARLLATAEKLADHALEEHPPSHDFVASVSAKVRQALPSGTVDANVVARRMRLGVRTLQRRLEEHGTNFTELCENVRKGIALELVRDPAIALAEVAQRSGFSDGAAFGRAFKRWTLQSPGAYRKGRTT